VSGNIARGIWKMRNVTADEKENDWCAGALLTAV